MIFVTGGTGLLGAHLLFELTKNSTPVRAMYRSKNRRDRVLQLFSFYDANSAQAQFDKIEWVKGDILDIPFLENAMQGCSHVYHCAALVSFNRKDFNRLIKVNREGTANVVNCCLTLNVDKLCYVSSTAAVGDANSGLITESDLWKKTPETSGYSISKYSAEKEVWRGIEEGLNAVIVNPSVILGAGDWNESSLTIFNTLEKGRKYYPPGSNATVDARDVAQIMVQLMASDISAERFLCIGSNQSFNELITEISRALGKKPPRKKAKRWQVEFARRLLGFFALFSSKPPSITKENVISLFGNKAYSSAKVSEALNFQFRDLKDSIKNSVQGRIQS